jgi:hypothetical protein
VCGQVWVSHRLSWRNQWYGIKGYQDGVTYSRMLMKSVTLAGELLMREDVFINEGRCVGTLLHTDKL